MSALLQADDIVVSFGGVQAVKGATVTVTKAEICGLIGPNGAGKSTLVDAISGFERPNSGRVSLGGTEITRMSAHHRARLGLSRTFQNLELFNDLTVAENLMAAQSACRGGSDDWTTEMVELFHLGSILTTHVRGLSHGRRRLVSVVRALSTRPQVLLLDEPAAGLDTAETQQLGKTLKRLAALGTGILLVDHDMSLVMTVCERVTVLEAGAVLATGTPAEVLADERVRHAYLGKTAA